MEKFTRQLQTYFAEQTHTVRLIWAITLPLLMFIIAYATAQDATLRGYGSYSEPFDLSESGLIWFIYVALTGFLQYCVWQPPK